MTIKKVTDLEAYKLAYVLSLKIYKLSIKFPKEETYSLTDQIRRSSRSVCANLSEAWSFRDYENSFKFKLNIAEGEIGESITWINYCFDLNLIEQNELEELIDKYSHVKSMIRKIRLNSKKWCFNQNREFTQTS